MVTSIDGKQLINKQLKFLETNFNLNDEQPCPSTRIPLAARCSDLDLVDLRDESFNYFENVQNMETLEKMRL
ncbi:unnamed protein product [Brachionus calyciflorus]|uniref:Uncharacterized protein n=1 Tax=Brachionus calyciflorus TaxID=104777 RepID=A0A814L5S1_9BILA|nr:unnamed protein product [Brachionus calyciflorus]